MFKMSNLAKECFELHNFGSWNVYKSISRSDQNYIYPFSERVSVSN